MTPLGGATPTPSATPSAKVALGLIVDPSAGAGSDGNGVAEPGETFVVAPVWLNGTGTAQAITGLADNIQGPPGATYTIVDNAADYGNVAAGGAASCQSTGNCYAIQVSIPAVRPPGLWEITFDETLSDPAKKTWTIPIGETFEDVPRNDPFYKKIETIAHHKITSGCATGKYCPDDDVTRAGMSIFVAKAVAGDASKIPSSGVVSVNGPMLSTKTYDCRAGGVSIFSDVLPTDSFCKHVHYLAALGITLGCSPTAFCPSAVIDREQMAAFIARAMQYLAAAGPVPTAYTDPVTGFSYSCDVGSPKIFFTDVPASSPYCRHIHFLWAKAVVSGCSPSTYCPTLAVTRGVMAKFLTLAFKLLLYGP